MARPATHSSLNLMAALAAGLLALGAHAAPKAAAVPAPGPGSSEVQLRIADEALRLVETQYSQSADPTDAQTREKRFGQGEVQYLLGDWRTASVLFYDLVSDEDFRAGPDYGDALFYLSDALYQQGNVIGARLYLKDLLALESPRFQQGLARYLEVSHELGQVTEVEAWIAKARRLSKSGQLSPELRYAYGRALQRSDALAPEERTRRVRELYTPLAEPTGGALRLPASYVLGVLLVQEGRLEEAATHFGQLSALPRNSERDRQIHELSLLAHGRVHYELGHWDLAVDRYNQVGRRGERYVESLYEIAWAQVRKGDFARARNATELLLLAAPDSPLAPQARLLQANLLLKLKRYEEATESYNGVINEYAPVRDELEALLTIHQDPVAYFDELLAKNRRVLDVNLILPEVARKFATTQTEVADGLRMISDLEVGREELGESRHVAQRILAALGERGLEVFPDLQEGYLRADAVETSLVLLERESVLREQAASGGALTGPEQAELERSAAEREALHARVIDLPTTLEQVQLRQARQRATLKTLDREAFGLGYEVQASNALAAALRKWVRDTRVQLKHDPAAEETFLGKVQSEEQLLADLGRELAQVREQLADEGQRAGASLAGEETLKERLVGVHARQRALFDSASVRPGATALSQRLLAHAPERARITALRLRASAAKDALREKLATRTRRIREKVAAEERLLDAHAGAVASAGEDTRNLVGRIAFDSFKRVHQQFYELVLKADVGVVDVAFTRKQNHTSEIQRIAAQKDRELRLLDREFSEVLEEDQP